MSETTAMNASQGDFEFIVALLSKLLNPTSDGYQADYVSLEGRRLRIDADYDLTEDEAWQVERFRRPSP